MWYSVVILSLFVVLTSARNVPYFPPLSPDLVNYINKLNTTWKVSKFWGRVQLCRVVGIGSCLPSYSLANLILMDWFHLQRPFHLQFVDLEIDKLCNFPFWAILLTPHLSPSYNCRSKTLVELVQYRCSLLCCYSVVNVLGNYLLALKLQFLLWPVAFC